MSQLLEEILSRDNMMQAYRKVKANKGASGVDGVSIEEIDGYLKENWVEIRERIRKRRYKPQPVRRVEILDCPPKTGPTFGLVNPLI